MCSMRISSFNINKFCGPYSLNGYYYNPRNLDFKTAIKEIVDSKLKDSEDIFFIQEFTDNQFINVSELFPTERYNIYCNSSLKVKSCVVAITLKDSTWKKDCVTQENEYANKIIGMSLEKLKLNILCIHNTDDVIKNEIDRCFDEKHYDIILGDFDDSEWIDSLEKDDTYRDLVTNDMITYKPAQSTVDRVFVNNEKRFLNRIVFNGVFETFTSDHNVLSFSLNI